MKKFIAITLLTALSWHAKADVVSVSGRQILVNGFPYVIKGICYNPVPKGSTERSWQSLTQDLALMNEAGINTIRVYAPIDNEAVLDEIDEAGIKVIIGFGYNMDGYYDILSGSYLDYIIAYKDHDAILFWEFGNEYNYHPEWFDNDINNWYTALNEAADEAKYEDENHPAATAHGELPSNSALSLCPDVDIWGLNIYRWDNPGSLFDEWSNLSPLPMYLSEAGADSYMAETMNGYDQGENEQAQADATRNILNSIFDNQNICSGVTIFEFSDEWWKAGDPAAHDAGGWAPNSSGVPYDGAPNEEYWGIVDIDRNKKKAFEELKTLYNSISDAKNPSNNRLKIFPNPATHQLHISGIEGEMVGYEIIDATGKLMRKLSGSHQNTLILDIHALDEGFYFIKCIYPDTMQVQRFLKN